MFASLLDSVKANYAFAEDGTGNIWLLSSKSDGVFICDADRRTLRYYPVSSFGLAGHKVAAIAAFNGQVMVITNNSIVTVNEDRQVLTTAPYPSTPLTDLVFTWKTIPVIVRKNGDIVTVRTDKLIVYNLFNHSMTTLMLPPAGNIINFPIPQDNQGQIFFDHGAALYSLSLQNTLELVS